VTYSLDQGAFTRGLQTLFKHRMYKQIHVCIMNDGHEIYSPLYVKRLKIPGSRLYSKINILNNLQIRKSNLINKKTIMSFANTNDRTMLEINLVNLVILIVIIYSIFMNKIKKIN